MKRLLLCCALIPLGALLLSHPADAETCLSPFVKRLDRQVSASIAPGINPHHGVYQVGERLPRSSGDRQVPNRRLKAKSG